MIEYVAIKTNGVIYHLPKPNRHHHIIKVIVEDTGQDLKDDNEQGFLDEHGVFYDRVQALAHALTHNQVKKPSEIRAGQLFSEDLW